MSLTDKDLDEVEHVAQGVFGDDTGEQIAEMVKELKARRKREHELVKFAELIRTAITVSGDFVELVDSFAQIVVSPQAKIIIRNLGEDTWAPDPDLTAVAQRLHDMTPTRKEVFEKILLRLNTLFPGA